MSVLISAPLALLGLFVVVSSRSRSGVSAVNSKHVQVYSLCQTGSLLVTVKKEELRRHMRKQAGQNSQGPVRASGDQSRAAAATRNKTE